MRIILTEDIDNLGYIGAVVDVKPGFARNYLLPRKKALLATPHNLEVMKNRQKKMEQSLVQMRETAEQTRARLEAMELVFERKAGEKETLFGSVTAADVEAKLTEMGVEVERRRLLLPEAIKRLGSYTCQLKLFRDVQAELKIRVLAEGRREEDIPDAGDGRPVEEAAQEASETEDQE